jgi:hypothetical protein
MAYTEMMEIFHILLKSVLKKATFGYSHLYAYGEKCSFLSEIINRKFKNLQDFRCLNSRDLKHKYSCGFSCHKLNSVTVL